MAKKTTGKTMDQYLIDITRKNRPQTVDELVKLVQAKYPLREEEILEHVLRLQDQGKMRLKESKISINILFRRYIRSGSAIWFWTTSAITAATVVILFTLPANAYPFAYARYILGSIFVLFLPGYSLTKALFPLHELDNIERIALSVGMSIALVPIIGLLLNYTPWGIRITPVTLSLLALTMIFATAALLREHQVRLRETQ